MRSPQPNLDAGGEFGWRFWCLAAATGIAAGLAAGLLMRLLRLVQWLAWGEGAQGFAAAVAATSASHRVAVLALAGVAAALGGLALHRGKRGGGGHSGEFSAVIWFRAGRMPFLRSLAQGALSIVLVGLGASLGREAAPKQAGAAFGSLFARTIGLSPSHTRILVAFGAGAGIAAVYEVPLGGALFSLEVLLGALALPLIAPAVLTSGLATFSAWLLLPDRPTYAVPSETVASSLIGFAIVAGLAAGLAAAAYVRLIVFADARRPSGRVALAAPVVVLTLLGGAAIFLPQLLGNGKDVAEQAFLGELGWPVLALLVVAKPLATAACMGSGAPGGLFTPTIASGAALGGALAAAYDLAWPGAPSGACALVTATAFLAAATQGPISATVLMLELTRRLDALMVPVLLAVAGAMLVARFLEPRSIYACRIHEGRAHAEADAGAISVAAPYAEVLRALPEDGGALRVLDETGACLGEIDRAALRDPARIGGPLVTATAGDFLARERPAAAA